jgi:hypothetical protein
MIMSGLLAGVGVRDISPRQPTFLCGFPYAQRISTGVHDPLCASALCLRHGAESAVLVAVDNLFVNPWEARRWRRSVSACTGVPEERVFISTSHTHSGPHTAFVLEWGPSAVVPEVDPAYLDQMHDGIVAAAADAASHLRPAELAWTGARVDGVGGNRHDPQYGARDSEAGLLVVRARGGAILAVSLTYCMHPTVLHEDSTLVSSDFPHYTRAQLRETLGEAVTVLYHTGPAGNQSPRYHVQAQTFAEAERLGRSLGRTTAAAVQALRDTDFTTEPALRGALAPVVLPRRELPPLAEAQRTYDDYRRRFEHLRDSGAPKAEVRTAECDMFGADETRYIAECVENGLFAQTLDQYDPVEVQALRLGDTCLVGFPGELFVEYSLMLKWQAARRAIAVNLVNGELQGYIVTAAALREGRYETHNRCFAPAAGRVLLDAALGLVQQL